MEEFAAQIAMAVVVLAACFVGPAIALYFLVRRKRQARMQRRSPIGMTLLRGPGHSLREQLEDTGSDVIFDLMVLMVVPLMALAIFLAQGHIVGLTKMMHLAPFYALGALAFIAFAVRKLIKAGTRLD